VREQLSAQDVNLNLNHKFSYNWNLKDGYPAKEIDYHGTTVMTTFACGGGSTMGYKLAGYDVIAANDIDPQMAKVYKANHNPKQFYLCGIKDLLNRNDLPKVDVLDGSPPCSVFSMAGSREGAWQKDKMFREGQAKQILDDLFFDFIDLAEKMQPKVVIAENVKGMLQGHAKWYTREVVRRFTKIGYNCQVFLLNAATMGVPQKRERVFFIAHKTNKKIKLSFNEKTIKFNEIYSPNSNGKYLSERYKTIWDLRKKGDSDFSTTNAREFNRPNNDYNHNYIYKDRVCNTIPATNQNTLFDEPRYLNSQETIKAGSFPLDYNFLNLKVNYLIGMSVPPVMMAQVANEVYNQLIKS
jgi:DNA (cytosine-5)-methyltransferase 1